MLVAMLGGEAMPQTGTDAVSLPPPERTGGMSLDAALAARRSVREFKSTPLRLAEAAQLLWAAQGMTSRDGGRTAPSAGALYPLEIHLVAGSVEELAPGVYRYDPKRHQLAPLVAGDRRQELADAALDQDWMAEAPAMIAIAAVYSRTSRKYGERAERYVHMEVGHVVQNIYLEATALGLGTCMVGAFEDDAVRKVLDVPDNEAPLGLMPVGHPR
jgi:SagB-type dehydrogenase family enzyme